MEISELPQSSILYLYADKEHIKVDPEYQRMSDIWPIEKRQLLIDSILNGFDIPKIYLHKYPSPTKYKYSIIDGKQRLEAIWKFIAGDYSLAEDFSFIDDDADQRPGGLTDDADQRPGGLTYGELAEKYPKRKIKFDSYNLSVVVVETDDLEIIEDMFSRLNEAVPLNAAEKRNAFPSPLTHIIKPLTEHTFFQKKVPFANRRFRYNDLAAKFLLFEYQDKLVDTKKVYLDRFVKEGPKIGKQRLQEIEDSTRKTLQAMNKVFTEGDPLLKSIGNVVLYYFLFKTALREGWINEIERSAFADFQKKRENNRDIAQEDIGEADYDLLEFDRYVQAPNDAHALKFRFEILKDNIQNPMPRTALR